LATDCGWTLPSHSRLASGQLSAAASTSPAAPSDASGDLIYAASMSTTPADLADTLARNGARIAMELDINPEWVQLDTARSAGGPLTIAVPGQVRPADQYLAGWTRDFITVLAPLAGAPATLPVTRHRAKPVGWRARGRGI